MTIQINNPTQQLKQTIVRQRMIILISFTVTGCKNMHAPFLKYSKLFCIWHSSLAEFRCYLFPSTPPRNTPATLQHPPPWPATQNTHLLTANPFHWKLVQRTRRPPVGNSGHFKALSRFIPKCCIHQSTVSTYTFIDVDLH